MRVLLVENNLSNCLIARSILERDGYEVRVATNGSESLDMARQAHFDVVLLDIFMPEMDGVETFERFCTFQTESRRPLFFALTAYDSKEETRRYVTAGFDGVIAKPLRPRDVARAIDICVENGTPELNLRGWSRQQAQSRPLLDWTIIQNGPGLADDKTRDLILANYRSGLSQSLQALSSSMDGRLNGNDKDTKRFMEALHSLRSASLTIGMDRAPHLAAKLRDLPADQLAEGIAHMLYAVKDSLPVLQEALRDPASITPRERGVVVKMRG